MHPSLRWFKEALCLTVLIFFLAGCGGSSSKGQGGFTAQADTVRISIRTVDTVLPANVNSEAPSLILPFTTSVIVNVERTDGSLPVDADGNPLTVQLAVDGVRHGAISTLDDPDTADVNEFFVLLGNGFTEASSGQAQFFFTSFSDPGVVTLTASVRDPVSGRVLFATLQITVEGVDRPVAALSFGGPFIDAVIAGQSRFGGPPTTNGVYSRVISVIATDPNGNPVPQGTPILMFVVDSPIVGFPTTGSGSLAIASSRQDGVASSGSFFVAGSNGNPLENDFLFSAPGGQFITRGVRPFDRLVLDGRPQANAPLPDNRDHTGIRVVQALFDQNTLFIDQLGTRFNPTLDNGPAVPYIIGRAQHGTILSPVFTDVTGTAETLLNYPVFRVGQTAVLVACSVDLTVCTVLNTCNVAGANCDPVYLAALDSDAPRTFTTSAPTNLELGPNTAVDVEFCIRDPNFVPVAVEQITYSISSNRAAIVTVNGSESDTGVLLTRGDGCVIATIASTGQIAGSDDISILFTTDGADPIELNIVGPGAGNLLCTTNGATVSLQLIDNNGTPIPDTFVSDTFEVANDEMPEDPAEEPAPENSIPSASVSFTGDPQVSDTTDLTANISLNLVDSGDSAAITFTAQGAIGGGATFTVTFTRSGSSLINTTSQAVGSGGQVLSGSVSGTTVTLSLIGVVGMASVTFAIETTDEMPSAPPAGAEPDNTIPSADVTYDPATQLTDAEGMLTAMVNTILGEAGDAVTVTFSTISGAECSVTFFAPDTPSSP